ncbi:MAG: carbonic anhydrase [Deltaproteobacteria bacterium]|nr:MAG: carbonic anhydrase [Deltaproteobacteria bacterium]
MKDIVKELLKNNERFADEWGSKKDLTIPPRKRIAVLTCMDARVDPLPMPGLEIGDAHVVRNAGGRASDDAIRSLVISHKLLGTDTWLVIHHTDCGMETFTDEEKDGFLIQSLETAVHDGKKWVDGGEGPGSLEGSNLSFRNPKSAIRMYESAHRVKGTQLLSG